MCGICGIYDAAGRGEANSPLLRRMSDSLAHRGPDNDGFYTDDYCGLGHRRLKIIDLSPLGKQPMTNEDGTVWISFNGEIYNYLELRPPLVQKGHQIRSQSDTEIMLHLYEEEGEEFLKKLNGMFALALWDKRRQRLILARDRFGKKPIYYWTDGTRLLFGSELKALLCDAAVPREIDPEALSFYIALGYVPCPRTIFKNVYKLPPASYLVAERSADGRLQLHGPQRYWSISYQPDHSLTEEHCTTRIREIIQDSVRIRMFSDVPLGAFLSGGLDSSTVVASMAKNSSLPVETFSISFDEDSFNEAPYAEMVAKKFGTNHHTFRCTPDALEVLPILAHHYDEPFADSSMIPTYYVSKIAREHVTVALSGDGGDEIFAGYTRYDNAMQREQWSRMLPDSLIRGAFRIASEIYPQRARGWGVLNRNAQTPFEGFVGRLTLFQPFEQARLLTSSLAPTNGKIQHLSDEIAARSGAGDLLSRMQYLDQMLYLPDDILVKVDRASMAVSLETRAPLLDYRLAEFLATVPPSLRYHAGVTKFLLKRAMENVLPREIIYRAKKGFSVPMKSWFRQDARIFLRETLLSKRAEERGIFQASEVNRLIEQQAAGREHVAYKLWGILFFELWCQKWLDQPVAAV